MGDGIEIKNKNGHYELYVDGKFHSTHDTMPEAIAEAEEIRKNEKVFN